MAVNRGKDFETQIRTDLLKVPNTSVYRLQDTMGGFKGASNICDFIVYKYPIQLFLECKTHYGNTLPFSCITKNQWDGMLKQSKIRGVQAGVLVWFMDHDATYFIPISVLQRLKNEGSKSLNIKMRKDDWILVSGKKKRVMFEYNMAEFMHRLAERSNT